MVLFLELSNAHKHPGHVDSLRLQNLKPWKNNIPKDNTKLCFFFPERGKIEIIFLRDSLQQFLQENIQLSLSMFFFLKG